jgi:micrococcal nuclease
MVTQTRIAWFLTLTILLVLSTVSCSTTSDEIQVIEVVDGDTIIIEGGSRVRYIGVDTPEIYPDIETYGIDAWQANRGLVEGKKIHLGKDVSDTDKYGRLLRYVYVGNILINAELVRLGLAKAKAYPPDIKYQKHLSRMEIGAKENRRGIWIQQK